MKEPKIEHTKVVETEERVEVSDQEELPSTESTKSTGPEEKGNAIDLEAVPDDLVIWPPVEARPYLGICHMARQLVENFFPKSLLVEVVVSELSRCTTEEKAKDIARLLVDQTLVYFESGVPDADWTRRLKVIFEGQYPLEERESWGNGRLCQRRYPQKGQEQEYPMTFKVDTFDPIREPKVALGCRIAPRLYDIHETKGNPQIIPTAEAERFFNGEIKAVPKSSLYEATVYNRPVWRVGAGWQKYVPGRLPRKVIAAELIANSTNAGLVKDFIDDLRDTFAWAEDHFVATYVGYLIQPMISHLAVGQMPAYGFFGPTKSGKGYLSNVLPSIIYSRPGEPTVVIKKLPNMTYEMEVFLSSCKEIIFLCFDEIKNATDEELKLIDAFCTQRTIQMRRIRYGYHEVENLFTLSLTAVHRTFSDETYGRLALIKLNQSRSDKIADFHVRWKGRGAKLQSALFNAMNNVDFDMALIPRVQDRRPGFSIVAHFIEKTFGLKPDYKIESANNEILDEICRMYEEAPSLGDKKGAWSRYSPSNFVSFMAEKYERQWKKSTAAAAINTALGYCSTRHHPNYKDSGYPAESGKFYHIEVREEGIKNKRTFIYVQQISSPVHDQIAAVANTMVEDKSASPLEKPVDAPACFADKNHYQEHSDKCVDCNYQFACFSSLQSEIGASNAR